MVQSPNPRSLVIFGGKIKTSQRPRVHVAEVAELVHEVGFVSFDALNSHLLDHFEGWRRKVILILILGQASH